MPGFDRIIGKLELISKKLRTVSNDAEAEDYAEMVDGIIEQLRQLSATTSKTASVKPCWADANQVYEWGIKKLPPAKHNYRDIHRAATERADAPTVRIPASANTFAQHVRAYRRVKGLKSHRQTRSAEA